MHRSRSSVIDILFTVALFCVFCATALAVVLIGAGVYTNTSKRMDTNFSSRTAAAYLSEKVRQGDENGAASVGSAGGSSALVLTAESGGTAYNTYIYYYDGYLRELMQQADMAVNPADGQQIAAVGGLTFSQIEPGLFRASLTGADGTTEQLMLHLSSSSGGGSQ